MKFVRLLSVTVVLAIFASYANVAQAGFVFSNSSNRLQNEIKSVSSMSVSKTTQVEKERFHHLETLLWLESAAEKYAWGHHGTSSTTGSTVSQSQTSNVPAANLAETPRTSGSLVVKLAEEPVPQSRYMPTSLFRPPRA